MITFNVVGLGDGQKVLAREITEAELTTVPADRGRKVEAQDIVRLAESAGIGDDLQQCLDAGQELGLCPRAWKTSIMFTPEQNRSRMLFTVWARPIKGRIRTYVGRAVFAEVFPVSESLVAKHLGPEGYRYMTKPEASTFIRGLRALLSGMKPTGAEGEGDT